MIDNAFASGLSGVSLVLISAGIVPLTLLLLAAAWSDLQTARIPNSLVLAGSALALLLHAVLPAGYGFLTTVPGGLGILAALKGVAIGLAAMLPLYLLRAMGAGDVKLMAMVGAFLGPDDVITALVGTLLAGGAVGLAVALSRGVALQMFRNIGHMLYFTLLKLPLPGLPALEPPPRSAAKAPYAVAIALGTFAAMAWPTMLSRFY